MTRAFYDDLAPLYHLIYDDWDASIERQAAALDLILRDHFAPGATRVIDVAAGIGTQALGLARNGYRVVGADNSIDSVRRGLIESTSRRLGVNWVAADMRALVRQRIARGEKPEAIRHWLIERYGDYVSYDPPLSGATALLWATPILLLAIGGWIARSSFRGRR